MLTKPPEVIQVMSQTDIQNLIHEFNVYKIELEMQNENLRKTQMELEESHRKYYNLYDFAPVGYLTFDEHGLITDVNLTAATLFGLKKDKIINRSFSKFISPEFQKIFYAHRECVLKNRKKQSCQLKLIGKGGNEYYTLLESVSVGDDRGIQKLIFSSVIDITAQKKIEEELKRNEVKYRTLFEQLSEAVYLFDMNGKIIDINDSATQLLGLSKDEIIGRKIQDLDKLPEEELKKLNRVFTSLKNGENIGTFITKIFWENNEYHWLEFSLKSIRIGEKLYTIQALTRDITEYKRREREMKMRLMKYELEDGNLYLVKEKYPSLALEAFKDLLNVGYQGVLISRSPNIKQKFPENVQKSIEFFWLTENEAKDALRPMLNEMISVLDMKIFQEVILIDRLDYIMTKNNYKKVLEFIQELHDKAYLKNHIIIISIDPKTLTKVELSKLEKEARELVPIKRIKISDKYLNILKFVFKQNMIGIYPTLTDIKEELGISKPTVIKRVRELELAKYLAQSIKGRSKLIKLTEKGNDLFF